MAELVQHQSIGRTNIRKASLCKSSAFAAGHIKQAENKAQSWTSGEERMITTNACNWGAVL